MLITNVGLAAASTALPEGPYIHIIKFEIGSAYGYTPDVNQTALQGNILYGGDSNPANWAKPTSYVSIGNNTLNIILEIPPEAGPWEFGEVGIFAADSSGNPYLFAVAVFQSPQTKFSSLGTNVVSSYQLNCLLKLQQSTAIFQIDTDNLPPDVYDIYQWSDVYPPSLSANPDIPSYNVKEPNSRGDGTFLITTSDSIRTYVKGAYSEIFTSGGETSFTVANASSTYIEVAQTQLNSSRLPTANRSMLIQTHAGFWRSVSSVTVSGSNYRLNLNCTNDGTYANNPLPVTPQIGEAVHIYSDMFSGGSLLYEQVVGAPSGSPIASVGTPGLAYGDAGTYMPGGGRIQVFGMLQTPSTSSGRELTGADDLNNIALPSGMYYTNGGTGYPSNMPFSYPANIWIHNIGNGTSSANGTDITQIAYPWNEAGGDGTGVGGLPPYWRQGYNSGTNWTAWQPYLIANKQGGQGLWTTSNYQPLTQNGIGYVAFIVLNGDSSQSKPEGTVMTLPGRPGTWISNTANGPIGAAADFWSVWTRIA